MLELRGVGKVYRTAQDKSVCALSDINIRFPETGMVFVLGRSGSGKSTLLHIIGGLDRCDTGEVLWQGRSLSKCPGRALDDYRNTDVGFVFQECHLLEEFSVGENLALALELQGSEPTAGQIEQALATVGLSGFASRRPNELSGGQRQRVAIARALIKQPRIILADEPSAALDSKTGEQIFSLLREQARQRLVIVVSHDRDFAERYADRIIELADGCIFADRVLQGGEQGPEAAAYQPLRARLPIKRAARMGAAGLKHKRLRAALSALLAVLALAMFGITDTVAAFDRVKLATDSMIDAKVSWAVFSAESRVYQGEELLMYTSLAMDDAQLALLAQQSGLALHPICFGAQTGYEDRFRFSLSDMKITKEKTALLDGYFYGFSTMDGEALSQTGFTLTGRMPQRSGEIVITELLYRQLKTYGFQNNRFGERIEKSALNMLPQDENSIIGKHFTVDTASHNSFHLPQSEESAPRFDYTVVGVLDTGFDYERFADFLPDGAHTANEDSMLYRYLLQELETSLVYSPHALCYVLPEDVQVMALRANVRRSVNIPTTNTALRGFDVQMTDRSGAYLGMANVFADEKAALSGNVVWLDGTPRTQLAANEILLSSALMDLEAEISYAPLTARAIELFGTDIWQGTAATQSYLLRIEEAALRSYVATHINEHRAALIEVFGDQSDASLQQSFLKYLQQNPKRVLFEGAPTAQELQNAAKTAFLPTLLSFFGFDPATELHWLQQQALLATLAKIQDKTADGIKKSTSTLSAAAPADEKMRKEPAWLLSLLRQYYVACEVVERRLYEDEAFLQYVYLSGLTPQRYEKLTQQEKLEKTLQLYSEYITLSKNAENRFGELCEYAMWQDAFFRFYKMAGVADVAAYYSGISLQNAYTVLHDEVLLPGQDLHNGDIFSLNGVCVVGIFDAAEVGYASIVNDRLQSICKQGEARLALKERLAHVQAIPETGYYTYAMAVMPDSENEIAALVELGMDEKSELRFALCNPVIATIDVLENDFVEIAFILRFVSLGFLLFAVALIALLIGSSIAQKQRDIGILRALGAGKREVYTVFFVQAAILSVIQALPAALLTAIATVFVNRYAHSVGARLSFLHFGVRQLLLLLVVSLAASLLAALLPIKRLGRLSPAEILRGK
ncbi:MAG: ATP-binding cassette domain-containing protein [Clostridia bacterium]|nr:ATP-binding cassette domain-containing protein [Clostridia bacterium]